MMNTNSGDQDQLNRNKLLSEYESFLQNAKADKYHIIKYASVLNPVPCDNLIQKVDADIDFANRKILELSIPFVFTIAPSESPSPPVIPAGVNTGGDIAKQQEEIDQYNAGVWSLFGGLVLGVSAAGLLAWGMQRKENLETVGEVLHIVKTVMNPGR